MTVCIKKNGLCAFKPEFKESEGVRARSIAVLDQ